MSILGLNATYENRTCENSYDAKTSKSDYAQLLQKKFNYLNKSTTMNGIPTTVSVSPAFIEKCAKDPEKAAYLEENLAAIPDCVSSAKANCLGTVTNISYQIDSNGEITAIMSGTNDPDGKIARENAEKKVKEQQEAKKKQKQRISKRFSVKGKSIHRATEKLIKKVDFSDTTKTSGAAIRKTDCIEISEEARLALEKDKELQALAGADEEEQSEDAQTLTGADAVEQDAEEASEQNSGKVAVNEGKRARQIAAAQSRGEIQQVLALLQGDMADCKAGLESGMCDESEIAKVEALINMAKARMGQVPQESDDAQTGMDAFDLASLL